MSEDVSFSPQVAHLDGQQVEVHLVDAEGTQLGWALSIQDFVGTQRQEPQSVVTITADQLVRMLDEWNVSLPSAYELANR
ncbi:MAG: hypothetical protein ACJ757_04885 [Gaiellaceae bacterium]